MSCCSVMHKVLLETSYLKMYRTWQMQSVIGYWKSQMAFKPHYWIFSLCWKRETCLISGNSVCLREQDVLEL